MGVKAHKIATSQGRNASAATQSNHNELIDSHGAKAKGRWPPTQRERVETADWGKGINQKQTLYIVFVRGGGGGGGVR